MNFDEIKNQLSGRHDQLALNVLDQLRDAQAGITRARLVALNYPKGYTSQNADRHVRRAIKRLRNLGLVIVSSTDHAGYRIARRNETKIVRKFAEQQFKAAKSRMATARRVLKAYGLEGNLRMALGG